MDMKTPTSSVGMADERAMVKLEALARALGCSTDLFFEPLAQPSTGDMAQLLQMWLAIRSADDRQAVLTCTREIVKAQAHR